MIKRLAEKEMKEYLRTFPAVGILGPRQVGKTTIARNIISKRTPSIYLDLENDRDLAKLTDAQSFLEKHMDKCVIIDEVQRMPQLFALLRSLIDARRVPGRYILLGSASPDMIKGVSESLAGRIGYIALHPINLVEARKSKIRQDTHWYRGGFPDALTARNDLAFHQWMDNFISTYLERDLQTLFDTSFPKLTMRNFLTMLANSNGGIWNAESYARSLGITAPTVNRYLDFLEGAFLVHRLPAWFVNAKKRVVKAPKVYLRDTGIIHRLCRIHAFDDIFGHLLAGPSWEGYVVEQVLQLKPPELDMYYYRTQHGAESDIVLVKGIKPVACIEIKLSASPQVSKGFYSCMAELKTKNNLVLIPSGDDYPLGSGITVSGLEHFLKKILPSL